MRNFTQTTALFKRVVLCITLLAFQPVFGESIEANSFKNDTHEQRYRSLIDEIRCPVCQGQSIGGSNAGLAKDLREKVRELIVDNQTDDSIRQYMTDRYGDFVVFKPPMNKNTYLLWYAPFAFLAFGLFFFIRSLSRKSPNTSQAIDTQKAKDLLK
ncbi:cytochrome c-type biogenesis protein [Candidatus Thioglobus sp.]|jgi:cytochrome c-type biogenesis protein CcmH|uniref:cytochrome c-type biogenesis protein n=1 Tax=Candidatus Thioglobus sp. TaxID=2026721 RepID=UPI001D2B4F7F|nr:cytochrome c-type biogenesis protein [Candidatus Thioglobus sp.]MBT3277622.1 cytochrome c-type biogenesis protein CcmH [Candidatus Thioglobus sp.]MBT3447000.1 cytochrome c-type biogenesis protein CcmH [Candidatus Thioglobus sp.]MBT3745000.1 cytochrome c-type biogenesis protein CcmH [Candidatus Thioglobus sp.]MBT4000521.1 cytochrome c-type biogenesis protein CcmH [Candidatus Thioglobus sp.]MBT4181470.1 cytochrome c-type biogenesis protein CcmH [Candidatus Thioglobus sp.]